MNTVRHYVDQQATRQPDKVFMVASDPELSLCCANLRLSCIKFSKYFKKMGLSKGDKVSFMMGNGYQTTRIFLGTMYAGLVTAPINLQVQPSQLVYVLDHSDTKLIFVTEFQRERLEQAVKQVAREITIVVIDKDSEEILGDIDLDGFILDDVGEDDPALLLYTSGTTGVPKGCVLTQKNMISGGLNVQLAHSLVPSDIGLVSLPLYHINAEIVSVMAPLVSGSSIVMPERFRATDFWSLISKYKCTWFSVVPTIISYLVAGTETEGKGYDLEQVRFGRSASSALPPALHKAFEEKFGISIVETMGITETAAPVFSNPLDSCKRKYGSPGQAVGNLARVIDKTGADCPCGVIGEILIKGDNVMKEYYKSPEITEKSLDSGGWFHTGDLGYMDEDGFFFITGRIKELIIKGGENIAPKEIDECLYAHPAILDAAACAIPDEHYGEEIMVCYTLKPDCCVSEEELQDHCLQHLGKYKSPKVLVCLDDLPRGPSGKIQRLKLTDYIKEKGIDIGCS